MWILIIVGSIQKRRLRHEGKTSCSSFDPRLGIGHGSRAVGPSQQADRLSGSPGEQADRVAVSSFSTVCRLRMRTCPIGYCEPRAITAESRIEKPHRAATPDRLRGRL